MVTKNLWKAWENTPQNAEIDKNLLYHTTQSHSILANKCCQQATNLGKSVLGVAAVDLEDRSCRKEVGNPVVTSVDIQATVLE